MISALHIIVQGRVQGVYFRAYTQKQAQALKLLGFVRNLPNGDVEIVAQGAYDALQQLLKWCHRGPLLAKVVEVKVDDYQGHETFESFEIR